MSHFYLLYHLWQASMGLLFAGGIAAIVLIGVGLIRRNSAVLWGFGSLGLAWVGCLSANIIVPFLKIAADHAR